MTTEIAKKKSASRHLDRVSSASRKKDQPEVTYNNYIEMTDKGTLNAKL
jgi:hypothetical protein